MKTAILYTRVSSADQVAGTSLETQEKDIRDWCRRNGYDVLSHFQDAGESAKTMDRPGLLEALDAARKQRASAVVVWKLDRLSRDTRDCLGIRASLAKHGCELVSLAEPAGSDPMGQLVSTIMFGVAQFDNEERGRRCRRGMEETTSKGGWVFREVLGFRLARSGSLPILEPVPPLSNIIAGVLREFIAGAITKSQGVAALKLAGIKANAAHYIFTNPIYGGIIRSKLGGPGRDIKAAFPGLIAPEEWYKLEYKLTPPKRQAHTNNNDAFPLTGILHCSECGAQLWGYFAKSQSGRKYPYYSHLI